MKSRVIMAFKILNNHTILESNMLPKITNQRPERNCKGVKLGVANQLLERQPRLDVSSSTFFYATPIIWNSIITPSHANSKNVEAFKNYFKK